MSDEERFDMLLAKKGLQDEEATEQEDDFTLVFPYTEGKKGTANDLYFYKLGEEGNRLVKRIIGGEVFLQYDSDKRELACLVNTAKQSSQSESKGPAEARSSAFVRSRPMPQ